MIYLPHASNTVAHLNTHDRKYKSDEAVWCTGRWKVQEWWSCLVHWSMESTRVMKLFGALVDGKYKSDEAVWCTGQWKVQEWWSCLVHWPMSKNSCSKEIVQENKLYMCLCCNITGSLWRKLFEKSKIVTCFCHHGSHYNTAYHWFSAVLHHNTYTELIWNVMFSYNAKIKCFHVFVFIHMIILIICVYLLLHNKILLMWSQFEMWFIHII